MAELAEQTQKEAKERSNKRNSQMLRLILLPTVKAVGPEQPGPSDDDGAYAKALIEDPFEALGGIGGLYAPPFNLLALAMLPESSSVLTPIVEAMEINIDGFGHILQSRIDSMPEAPPDLMKVSAREKAKLTNFFAYANMRDSFIMLRRKARKDQETTGNAYWEVIRNNGGDIIGFEHVPSYQVRLGRQDLDPVETEVPTLHMNDDGEVVIKNVTSWQRFRKFGQARFSPGYGIGASASSGYQLRWFKEFGDRRILNMQTGEFLNDVEGKKLPRKDRANELIHFKLYSTRSPYGLPRYIGNLLSVYGERAAEEINFITFKNNNIPSLAILVSNGSLTEGSVERIQSFVEAKIQGNDNYSRMLILEAEGLNDGDDQGNIKIEMKPLVEAQHKDALFQNYSKNSRLNVRRSFRLPPVFTGDVEDLTRVGVEASRQLADEQIFGPERDEFDSFINRRLFPEMGIIYHIFKSNTPNTTDNKELVAILSDAEKTGGMTPRIARTVLERILGYTLPPFPLKNDLFDPDMPFSLLMANAVKNMASPVEPGQQVTAIKVMKDLGLFAEHARERVVDQPMREELMRHINKLQEQVAQLSAQMEQNTDV